MLLLTVYGEPAPKGSRTTGRRRDGSVFTRPASKREHSWVKAVAETARWRRAQAGELPAAPYSVRLEFYCRRSQRPRYTWPSVGDVDKFARAVLDGLVAGGLLSDDRHVVELVAVKRWAAAPGGEGVLVTIAQAEGLEAAAAPEHAYLRRDPCAYCGRPGPGGTIDHIVPRARGGDSSASNLTGACGPCGAAKGAWPLLPFLLLRKWAAGATGESAREAASHGDRVPGIACLVERAGGEETATGPGQPGTGRRLSSSPGRSTSAEVAA